ncbi:MAG: shikimate dehydrogenase [Clostridiaceae bacterium]|nr:shikimate dehydrogenase [Clostridiaceae bacterium]
MELDKRVNGTTKLTGLIGNPVEHTVSPVLHNTLFTMMGMNGIYIPMKPDTDSLGNAVAGLKAAGFTGFNVTIPFKEAILEYLDVASEEVRLLGTANTVHIKDGRLIGHNTDGDGFIHAFRKQTGTDIRGKKVCVLGAGGTARALAVKLAIEGAGRICIINRTKPKADEIAEYINCSLAGVLKSGTHACTAAADSDEARCVLDRYDVIVNTTSAGMHPHTDSSPIKDDIRFLSRPIVYDVIYNPSETRLLRHARSKGCVAVNGAGMLFFQGLRSFEIWMGVCVPEKIVEDLLTEFLNYLTV